MDDNIERTAKVVEILNIREHTNDKGLTYYFTVKMDNDEVGDIGKKKRDALQPGSVLTYTISRNGQYTNFREVRTGNFGGGGGGGGGRPSGPAKTNAQTALECASRVFLERNRVNPVAISASDVANGITTIASTFKTWLDSNT